MRAVLLRDTSGSLSIRRPEVAVSILIFVVAIAGMAWIVAGRYFAIDPGDLWIKPAASIGGALLAGLICYTTLRLMAAPERRFYEYRSRIQALLEVGIHDRQRIR